jgi:tetratricopeptide (TPR) repeat protein
MRYPALFVLAASFLILAPVVGAQQEESIETTQREIHGIVRGASGQPVVGATVYLESSVGEVLQQMSLEGSGRFSFNAHKGIFYVRVVAAGFREYRARVDLNFLRRTTVTVSLVPDTSEARPQPPGPSVDKEYLQIPEGARKEFEKASRLLKEKKAAESIEPFRKAISQYEQFPAAHFLLGTALMDLRRWPEAQASLERAVALDDKQAPAFLALGTCLAQQQKFAEAEKPLRRGLELNPNTADGQLELGKVYWSLGRWQQAEPPARKSIELQHDIPLAHILLGNILLKKQDHAGALAEFKEYLRLEPNGPFAPGARDIVARLEKSPARP